MSFTDLLKSFGQATRQRCRGVAARLMLGFGTLAGLMVLLTTAALWHTHAMSREFVGLLDHRIPKLTLLHSVLGDLNVLNLSARDALLAADPAAIDTQLAQIEKGRTTIGNRINALNSALQAEGDARDSQVADEVMADSSGILVALVKFSRTLKKDDPEAKSAAAKVLAVMLQPKLDKLSTLIVQYQQEELGRLGQARDKTLTIEQAVRLQCIVILLMALMISALAAWLITRSIARPLRRAVEIGNALSQGNLSEYVARPGQDEAGRVLASFNHIAAGIGKVVVHIREGAEQVSGAARNIADGNVELSGRTAEQTQSLEFAANLLHELETHVDSNASNAQQADQRAHTAADIAQSGAAGMHELVASMREISAAAHRINEIITVIDDLAFQTNILALNAAVESARAGEQGRGFAVVASEVRSLAQRSATAAKEIKKLVHEAVEQVGNGTQRVDLVSCKIVDVVSSAREVSELIRHISQASTEQRDGIGRMGAALSKISRGGVRTAELVEHVASTSRDLNQMAADLRQRVAVFHVRSAIEPVDRLVADDFGRQFAHDY